VSAGLAVGLIAIVVAAFQSPSNART
jgi:hypothetical protein